MMVAPGLFEVYWVFFYNCQNYSTLRERVNTNLKGLGDLQ